MKLLAQNKKELDKYIDAKHDAQKSIVLRYKDALRFEDTDEQDLKFKQWLEKTSIKEGARVFHFLTHRGVEIHISDETTLMHTKTLKSIDGCVTIAKCRLKGYERVVFESGGNTGSALTEYGVSAGLETFCFLPEENINLLCSKIFKSDKAHLVAVKDPGLTKEAANLFVTSDKTLKHIPETAWRYEAAMFRGLFILEEILKSGNFDWIAQTISAAFGPIGIFNVLGIFNKEIGGTPRFLGIQQEANCPMYKSWKSGGTHIEPTKINSTEELLTKVMYDFKPHTYATFKDLIGVLKNTDGDLSTINHAEFKDFLDLKIEGKSILELLADKGIDITVIDGEVVEKTGLIALAGTLKAIESGKIPKGSKVLCCLTSGISQADGKSLPEYNISRLGETFDYIKMLSGSRSYDRS